MKKLIVSSLLVLAIIFPAFTAVQAEEWTHFNGDGVTIPTEIRAMAIDHDGVLWVSGRFGLWSYDGTAWKTWWLAKDTPRLEEQEWLIFPGDEQPLAHTWPEAIVVDNDNVKWFCIVGGVVRYDGEIWEFIRKERPEKGRVEWFKSAAVDQNNVKWFGTNEDGVWRYDGEEWTNYYTEIDDVVLVPHMAIDSNNTKWIAYTYDNGQSEYWKLASYNDTTWTRFFEDSYNYGATMSVTIDHDDVVWIGNYPANLCFFDGEELVKHFGEEIIGDTTPHDIAVGPDGEVWIITNGSVIKYNGSDWIVYDTNNRLPSIPRAICIDENNIKWIGTITGVSRLVDNPVEVEEAPEPVAFSITGNYPNPFNPETTIQFSLDMESLVSLNIFDVTGQKIKALVADHIPAGSHAVVWDGTDDAGTAVASGIYFCRMQAGGKILVHRMALMR